MENKTQYRSSVGGVERAYSIHGGLPDRIAAPIRQRHFRAERDRLDFLRRLIGGGQTWPQFVNDFAWDLLTIEVPDLRDPAAALPFAERACALAEERGIYGRWNYLDTLALAQHMTGDTANAIETQRRALGLLPPEYQLLRKEMEQRLAEYEAALNQNQP